MVRLRFKKYDAEQDTILVSNAVLAGGDLYRVHLFPRYRFGFISSSNAEIIFTTHGHINSMKVAVKEQLKVLGALFYDEIRGRE